MLQVWIETMIWKTVDIQLRQTKARQVLSDFQVCKIAISLCETLHGIEWQIDSVHFLTVARCCGVTD